MKLKAIIALLAAVAVIIGLMCVYTVDETEQAVITFRGKVNRVIEKPGLHFKLPVSENVITYPKNLQEWDGDPAQISTGDKIDILVDACAGWKITDPVLFFKTIGPDNRLATSRLSEIIDSATRNLIASNPLIEAVRTNHRELDIHTVSLEGVAKDAPSYTAKIGRSQIEKMILNQAQAKLEQFGINLVDVKIKRINYVEEVRKSVYGRMIAESKQIAEKYRSEGQGEAQKILGDKELELKRIESKAYRKSQEIRGEADAKAVRIYAQALSVDPEFYSFTKTLEIYSKALHKDSSLVLTTDSDIFKLLKSYSNYKEHSQRKNKHR
jgi:membrane protease subunit HflC